MTKAECWQQWILHLVDSKYLKLPTGIASVLEIFQAVMTEKYFGGIEVCEITTDGFTIGEPCRNIIPDWKLVVLGRARENDLCLTQRN